MGGLVPAAMASSCGDSRALHSLQTSFAACEGLHSSSKCGACGRIGLLKVFGDHHRTTIVISRECRQQQQFSCSSAVTSTSSYSSESLPAQKERDIVGRPKRGRPLPYGASPVEGGVNFSVHSSGAIAVSLCLFTEADLQKGQVTKEIALHPVFNKTGDIWHIYLPDVAPNLLYGYRMNGKFNLEEGLCYDISRILVDPYAKAVICRGKFGALGPGGSCWPQMAGMVPQTDDYFDWQGDARPGHEQKDLLIYELHIRGFTQHPSSSVAYPGTYLGVVEKLRHLKELGINAIELMPIHEFNELEYYAYTPVTGDHKMNFWGYSTINFFSPMTRYAASGIQNCGRDAIKEFKTLVREAHKLGIEVFMDVVFNHTAEGNEMGPIISFRGLDNQVYYMTGPKGEFYNYSGCGNTLNCNHPVVRRFIVDCLRYWVTEMHVDGFRFDLASIMTRASSLWDKSSVFGASKDDTDGDTVTTGTPLSEPPLIDMISNDAVLRGVKLIAEAWDTGGLYQVGKFPHWGIWSEWNGQYRDTVRLFIKGTDGMAGAFAQCLCGSPHLYQEGGRKPWHSVNFVTAHDGFSLIDLVSYNNKHNIANGEGSNDGETHNLSWNCGEEGELASAPVRRLRHRQLRNFLVALMVSQGVPMVTMGDEYAHTKGGNNNTYCHDNAINYFRWDKAKDDTSGLFRFSRLLFNFRRGCESLGLAEFATSERLEWHGIVPNMPDWSETSRLVAFSLVDARKRELYIAFNTSHLPVLVTLPERPGFSWKVVVDSSKLSPYDFVTDEGPDMRTAMAQHAPLLNALVYPMISYSSIILRLEPQAD